VTEAAHYGLDHPEEQGMSIHWLALLAVLAAPAAAQQVHVVGPPGTPGPHFESIQQAIDTAADGDVIVVEPGPYPERLSIVDRQLVLAGRTGPAGERAEIMGVRIGWLAPERSVVVRGFGIYPFVDPEVLSIHDCEGSVLVEDLNPSGPFILGGAPSRIARSGRVVIARSTLVGPIGQLGLFSSTPGGTGLIVEDSSVALYDCQVSGGLGTGATVIFTVISPSDGGPGLDVVSGTVLLAGTTVQGGQGGSGSIATTPCSSPADGGTGLIGGGVVRTLEATILGGEPGAQPGCGPDGSLGADSTLTGTLLPYAQTLRRLQLSSPVAEGGLCHVAIQGLPLEPLILLQSAAPLGTWLGGLKGVLAGAPPYVVYALGATGADGTLAFDVPIPAGLFPPGIEGVLLVDQLVTAAAGGGGLLSSPSSVVVVTDLP
jgi:hypothetical protein